MIYFDIGDTLLQDLHAVQHCLYYIGNNEHMCYFDYSGNLLFGHYVSNNFKTYNKIQILKEIEWSEDI